MKAPIGSAAFRGRLAAIAAAAVESWPGIKAPLEGFAAHLRTHGGAEAETAARLAEREGALPRVRLRAGGLSSAGSARTAVPLRGPEVPPELEHVGRLHRR